MSNYKAVIGLEMHCEMLSNAKVFSRAKNEYSDIPNINVRELDMGFPGTLPVLNKEVVKKSILAALVLNCEIPEYMYFDRKNYYYPDLPKGYQITQTHSPVGINGSIKINCGDYEKEVLIHDIHLEEDSASMDHFSDVSLINYNRSGVPLLELVTEPCLSNADEAIAFLEEIRRIYQYTNISLADTKKGQIRCDVNVSIMDFDATELGTKVEVKNVNSFSNVYDTINKNNDKYQMYYYLDHHWTTYAAYYAYLEYAKNNDIQPLDITDFDVELVTKDFNGTLYSKTNDYSRNSDSIYVFNRKNNLKVEYVYEDKVTDTMYEYSYLDKKDKYSLFLDNNHPLIIITNNDIITNKEIIVIKDSYANSLIPFLVNHFKKVHVIDPRYYNLSITSYLKENPNIKDGLIIYNANGLDDSSILGLE